MYSKVIKTFLIDSIRKKWNLQASPKAFGTATRSVASASYSPHVTAWQLD